MYETALVTDSVCWQVRVAGWNTTRPCATRSAGPMTCSMPMRRSCCSVVRCSPAGSKLVEVLTRQRTEGRNVGWLAEQIGIRLHDEKRTFADVLPADAIRSWAEHLLEADTDMFGARVEQALSVLTPSQQVAAYAGPVHVVHGELGLGSIVPASELQEMRTHAPHMTSTELAGTGHFLHAQAPDRFGEDLRAFLHTYNL